MEHLFWTMMITIITLGATALSPLAFGTSLYAGYRFGCMTVMTLLGLLLIVLAGLWSATVYMWIII